MVAESWFRGLWRNARKQESVHEKVEIGVLAFEVASLMSKIVHLWQSLSDKQVARLREEITNSVGIKKLVSEDEDFVVRLVCTEMIENMTHVAMSVGGIAKRCSDPGLKSFESVFGDLMTSGVDPYSWEFSTRKMERKVKKMEGFISINATLSQEMELLTDSEQTLKRMRSSDTEAENLLEYQKKVMWKQHEVKSLREISLWSKSYDCAILLLARSIFTIFRRIKHVFGIEQNVDSGHGSGTNSDFICRSHLVSALLQSSVHPAENTGISRFASGPFDMFAAKSGPIPKRSEMSYFHSGPLGGSLSKSNAICGKKNNSTFHSGPLGRSVPVPKSGPISGIEKFSKKIWQKPSNLPFLGGRKSHSKPNRLTQVGPFKGCMISTDCAPITNSHTRANGLHSGIAAGTKDGNVELLHTNRVQAESSVLVPQHRLLDAPPETLGAAALSLHYANVIILIEKLAASPHLIGNDARDDLYKMLPSSVRSALRARLRPYSKSLASTAFDTALAQEWTDAIAAILEWLAPLAHSMIRWQSERSFEQLNLVSRTNVLLAQTLYFANQEKTEAAITELLVGLNYVWRLGRELNTKALQECTTSRIFEECLFEERGHQLELQQIPKCFPRLSLAVSSP